MYIFFVPTEITFSGGKFVMQPTGDKEKKPWAKYLKPEPKTERMKYFNDVTKEIYESAFVHKQTQFLSYLNGQRQFRWDTKQKIEKLQSITKSYEEGIIPKENIFFNKYLTMPEDVTLKEVSFANRAASHISGTRQAADELLELMQNRKVHLFDSHMELRKWAANENEVVTKFIAAVGDLKAKVALLEDDVAHTAKNLCKKYGNATVSQFELKRKGQRQKEQKSKNKKKCKTTLLRNTHALLTKSGFAKQEIEEICPFSFGKKSTKCITFESLTKENVKRKNRSIAYLKSIGALEETEPSDRMSDESDTSDTGASDSSEDK